MPQHDLDDAATELDAIKTQIPGLTVAVLEKTITEAKTLFPNAYPSNLFKNVSKCRIACGL